jgi:hypothetical protein
VTARDGVEEGSAGGFAACSPSGVIFCRPLEQAAGGGFKAAKSSFLQPVAYGLKQKSLIDANRGFGAVQNPPALLKGGEVQSAKLGEFVREDF